MHHRIVWAVLAAVLLACAASPARADIVDLTDGTKIFRRPKSKEITTPAGEYPTDAELRASGRRNLKLAYDRSELGRPFRSSQIVEVYVTDAILNEDYVKGENAAENGFWVEAAQSFRLAADALEGAARQVALYKRMLAIANTNDDAATMEAANALIMSDPKTYYFGPAQEVRARILARSHHKKEALAALDKVINAPGMNVRDLYNAKYLETWLTKSLGADSPEKWAAAEKAYRSLQAEIEANKSHALAQLPYFKTLVALGETLRGQGKNGEAKKIFHRILASATDATDKQVLAGVYYGLGDVAFQEAMQAQKAGMASPATRAKVKDLLDEAALDYLRVLLLYGDYAGQRERFGATAGVARTFSSIFMITGAEKCDLARKAYDYYRQAMDMLGQGEKRRILYGEGKALKQRIDELCSAGEKEKGDKAAAPK